MLAILVTCLRKLLREPKRVDQALLDRAAGQKELGGCEVNVLIVDDDGHTHSHCDASG